MSVQRLRRGLMMLAATIGLIVTGLARADDASAQSSPLNNPNWPFPPLMDSVGNPAEEHNRPATTMQTPVVTVTHSWELPAITVEGQQPSAFREDQLVGTYAQPVWTTSRRFAETRVYVRPEGSLQFEYWFIPTINRHGSSEINQQAELEFGLPHRVQMDLYLTTSATSSGGPTYVNEAIEFRYAFADWGKIPGNPTYYIEYTKQDQGPDQLEQKLLFGGDFGPRWHWGADLTYQRDFGGERTNTYETTEGISYSLIDSKFDIGAEFKLQLNDFHGSRGHLHDNVYLGPSIQYRPYPRVHIDVTPLIGLDHESPALQLYAIIGYEF